MVSLLAPWGVSVGDTTGNCMPPPRAPVTRNVCWFQKQRDRQSWLALDHVPVDL